jgi:hypothetical protein
MAVQTLKLRHHEWVLRLDGMLEQAVDDVISQERQLSEGIDEYQRRGQQVVREIEGVIEGIGAHMAAIDNTVKSKARFIEKYALLKQEAEGAIQRAKFINQGENLKEMVML